MPKIPTTIEMKAKNRKRNRKNKNSKLFPAPLEIQRQTIPIQTQHPGPSQDISVQSQNIAVQSQNIPVQSQNIPVQNQNIPVQSQNIPVQNQNIPVQSQNFPVQSQNIPVQSQNFPVQSQNIPVQSQNISVPIQNVQNTDNNNPVVRQIVPIPAAASKPQLPNSVIQNASVMMQGIKRMAKFIRFQQNCYSGNYMFSKKAWSKPAPNNNLYSQYLPTPGSSDLYTSFETSEPSQNVESHTKIYQKTKKFTQNQKPGTNVNNEEQKLAQNSNLITKNINKQFPTNSRTLVEINSESTNVAELNNDNFNQTDGVNKVKVSKESQQSFQTKIQKQTKKLETRQNPGEIVSKRTESKPNQTITAKAKKTANQNYTKEDIKKVVRENLGLKMNESNTAYKEEGKQRGPLGVPKTFLYEQDSFGAIEPRKDFGSNPTSKWDMKTRIQTPQVVDPRSESKTFVQSVYADIGISQTYSPTEMYEEFNNEEEVDYASTQIQDVSAQILEPSAHIQEASDPPEILESGQKRLSAFQRLGPLAQPKKPKLTINLSLSKDQDVREVVETQKEVPVYDNEEIINSKDDIVMKFLPLWPWKKHIGTKKSVTARFSKTVMMMEQEQMEEVYEKENIFIMLLVKGYPPSWTKEEVLDLMLENLKGKTFIPCFIEFNSKECKFLVIRSRNALLYIHCLGFTMRKDDVEVRVTIAQSVVTLKKMEFVPRLILRKRLAMNYYGERTLDLSEFLLKNDISHFIYFPLNRTCNQAELVLLPSEISWEYLTEIILSRNRIKSIEGFCFESSTPRLKSLDLSHNYIDSIKVFLQCRKLPLKRLVLEGNPLCTDYTDPDRYIKVLRTIFPSLRELDNIPIVLKGDMPKYQQNYCPEDAKNVVEKFLEVYFPLLELPQDERKSIQSMYAEQAVMTITYRNKLRHDPSYKNARNLLIKSRVLLQNNTEDVHGASNIVKLLNKWPDMQHYPSTFGVDVIHHSESSTILTINGLLKLTADTLAEDETLLAFTRTVHLYTKHGSEYRIYNEMMYWDEPTEESSKRAFQILSVPKKNEISLKFESIPDDKIKDELVRIFMKLTELEKLPCERCLEAKDWHIKHALEYFVKLLKTDNIHTLMK